MTTFLAIKTMAGETLRATARYRIDVAATAIFVVLGFALSWRQASVVDPALLDSPSNTWFDADISRVYRNMTSRGSDHCRW